MSASDGVLAEILAQLGALQIEQQRIHAKLDALANANANANVQASPPSPSPSSPPSAKPAPAVRHEREKALYPGRVNLTTYPDQPGIAPYPLHWGAATGHARGPVVCSRLPGSIKRRNAIGAHSGSYSIYRALSIATGALSPTHMPDYALTGPPVDIPPQPAWADPAKIVSLDPYGHLAPALFARQIAQEGLDVRPSIAVTRARLKMSELDECVRRGELSVDGNVVLDSPPVIIHHDGAREPERGVEVVVSKAAVDPVWYLPGVADRFGIPEALLRRALFEDTGGMYPELITRPDIKVFLPPIGGLTVYIFGNPAYLSDESKHLTLRVHDECNGSDVFGSDICTCKPYLTYAILECIRTAQTGGVGLVVYLRKEGRALGEVTKYLVYNLRKRGGDSADRYFGSTEAVAGVRDVRYQVLMPDVLVWLGVRRVAALVSMSDMKYDAIVKSGIRIERRYDLPDHLIPPDSRVEIDAKIAAGYFSSAKRVTEEDLRKTVGRAWEDAEH